MADEDLKICEWRIPDEVVFQVLDGQAVVLNADSGRYFGLNDVGTRFWQGVEQGKTFEQITESVLAEYNVERTQLQQDLVELMGALRKQGLLEEAGELSP
jgi:hypothetical protein